MQPVELVHPQHRLRLGRVDPDMEDRVAVLEVVDAGGLAVAAERLLQRLARRRRAEARVAVEVIRADPATRDERQRVVVLDEQLPARVEAERAAALRRQQLARALHDEIHRLVPARLAQLSVAPHERMQQPVGRIVGLPAVEALRAETPVVDAVAAGAADAHDAAARERRSRVRSRGSRARRPTAPSAPLARPRARRPAPATRRHARTASARPMGSRSGPCAKLPAVVRSRTRPLAIPTRLAATTCSDALPHRRPASCPTRVRAASRVTDAHRIHTRAPCDVGEAVRARKREERRAARHERVCSRPGGMASCLWLCSEESAEHGSEQDTGPHVERSESRRYEKHGHFSFRAEPCPVPHAGKPSRQENVFGARVAGTAKRKPFATGEVFGDARKAHVNNEKQYEALRDKRMSKQRAARIANTSDASSHGGQNSRSSSSRLTRAGRHDRTEEGGGAKGWQGGGKELRGACLCRAICPST